MRRNTHRFFPYALGLGALALLSIGCDTDVPSASQTVEQSGRTALGGSVETPASGLRKLPLGERHMHRLTVRPGANGKLESSCVNHVAAKEQRAP